MDNFKRNLKHLGLTQEEIELYLVALEQGYATVLEFARKTNIPRTTVYLLIDSLIEKKMLSQIIEGKKKRYIPVAPDILIERAQKQKEQINETIISLRQDLPQLAALFNLNHGKPKIQYYEGVRDSSKIYEAALDADKIYRFCLSDQTTAILGEYEHMFLVSLMRKMIHTKEILSESQEHKKYQKEYASSRNEIVCLPIHYSANVDYMLYDDKVAFFTYKDRSPVCMVIHDQEIAHFERVRFMLLWDAIQKGIIAGS